MRFILALSALAFAFSPSLAHAQKKATLDAVSVHVFLEKSGVFSNDIMAGNFAAWNFAIQADGIDANEHYRAMLIKVRITAPGEHFENGKVADVTLTNRRTKKVVKRESIAGVYIGAEGAVFYPVYVPDAVCGPFELVVTGGRKRIAKSIEAACGE